MAYASSCGYVDVPAVEGQSGRGSTVRATICVSPGSGVVRIYGVERVESDTLVSIFAAYVLAQIYSGKSFSSTDLSLYFGRNVEDVSGPSAGALLTYAFYSILEKGYIDSRVSGTGAINLDGSVEAVGGIPQKLSALRSLGYRSVFLPVVNYIQYLRTIRAGFSDLSVVPLGGIGSILNISTDAEAQPLQNSSLENIDRISRAHSEMLRSIVSDLLEIYMSRVADRGSQSYREASALLNIASISPPPEGYPSVNLYYLALVSIAQGIIQGDLRGYGATLVDRAAELYNRSMVLLRKIFTDIPRNLSINQYILYILIIERAVDLISYSNQVKAYISSGDRSVLASAAGQIYGRSLSIVYWADLLGNLTKTGGGVSLGDIYVSSQRLLEIFGISNQTQSIYTALANNLGREIDLDGLRMLIPAYTLYSYLRNYSASIRASTISQIPLGSQEAQSYVETLIDRGYMQPQRTIDSALLLNMYRFSTWALKVIGNISPGSQTPIPQTLVSSLIATSSSASTLNMLALIYSGKASPPRSIELAGPSQQPQLSSQGGGGGGGHYYVLVSNILTAISIITALITSIIAVTSSRARRVQTQKTNNQPS
ncbi:MAG: S16 family serine protease [Sulfolobales archaeon]